jgi:hypothetical protein
MTKKAAKKKSSPAKKSAAKAPARAKSAKGEAATLDPIAAALRRRRAALLSR